jgi:hypothetical protein
VQLAWLVGGLLAAGCGPSAPPPVDAAAEKAAEEDMKMDAAKEAGRKDLDDDPAAK